MAPAEFIILAFYKQQTGSLAFSPASDRRVFVISKHRISVVNYPMICCSQFPPDRIYAKYDFQLPGKMSF
jgi:hypothetical protein